MTIDNFKGFWGLGFLYIYIYIYIYRERERERERQKNFGEWKIMRVLGFFFG
jgi:hypothetical protein